MPLLDVTDLLTDPDLATRFTVVRRVEVDGDDGLSRSVPTTQTCQTGVVVPAGDNALRRLAELEYMGKGIEVVTRFRLRGASKAGGKSYLPDLVYWPEGGTDAFLVVDVEDYTQFGAGFVNAICASTTAVDPPPGAKT